MTELLAQLTSPTGITLGAIGLILGMIHDHQTRSKRVGRRKP